MKSPVEFPLSPRIHPFGCWLLTGALLAGAGCVSQQTFDKTKAETEELTRTLEATRLDVSELNQRIAGLQAANRHEDAVTTELRASIQREQDMLPILRQRADEKLGGLQTQVASLVSQNRQLTREMAEATQEGASLQARVTALKQELEESRSLPPLIPPTVNMPAPVLPPPTAAPVAPAVTPSDPLAPPRQTAQADPVPPVKQSSPPRPAKADPAPADDSWTSMIANWVSSLWSWIFD